MCTSFRNGRKTSLWRALLTCSEVSTHGFYIPRQYYDYTAMSQKGKIVAEKVEESKVVIGSHNGKDIQYNGTQEKRQND